MQAIPVRTIITIITTEGQRRLLSRRAMFCRVFSCTGTTEGVAEIIAEVTGGFLHEILPEDPYTDEDLDYYSGGRADQEQADPNARPAIANSVEGMKDYDVVFLGYPIWHGQAPKIIYTFLERYDLSGKTIVPFCTSGSSGIGSSADNLHSLVPEAEWRDGTRFSGNTNEQTISDWLEGLDLNIGNGVSAFDLESGENGVRLRSRSTAVMQCRF